MRLKKLLICTPSHAIHGGVETIVNDLCRELPKRGWDPILALGKGLRFNDVNAYRTEYPDLPIAEIDGTKGTRPARLEALVRLIQRVRPDIVLSARIFDAYEAVNLCKKQQANLRLAVTIQAYEPPYFYDLRQYQKTIDLCVTSGNLIRLATLQWSNFPEARTVSIPGGVSPPRVLPTPRFPRSPIRIGYVGRLEQVQKRILDTEPFLRELDKTGVDYTLDVVGTGPCEQELADRVAKWRACGKVRFHGWQSKEQLYLEFFPNIDCLIHFAHTEGVTIAPREAMAHGVVPVISEFTGLETERQFIHHSNSLTFPVGDTVSAAANVFRLTSEPGLLERLSRNAIVSQTGYYTFAGSMDAWAEAFDHCMDQPRAVGALVKLNSRADGRLTRLGLSSKAAQRVRDFFGRKYVHNDPGSEWPTDSGLITEADAAEIMRFAVELEA